MVAPSSESSPPIILGFLISEFLLENLWIKPIKELGCSAEIENLSLSAMALSSPSNLFNNFDPLCPVT